MLVVVSCVVVCSCIALVYWIGIALKNPFGSVLSQPIGGQTDQGTVQEVKPPQIKQG